MSEEAREGGALGPLRRAFFFLPLAVFGIALVAARPRRGPGGWSAVGSDQLLGLFALVTFVVGYVSPRYMLPAYPIAAVLAGALVARLGGARLRWMKAGLVAVLLFHLAGWVDAATAPPSSDEERGSRLVTWLDDRGLRACYSASPLYHLVFAGGERVLISPLQKNRYPAYDQILEGSDSICYVFRDDQQNKRQHLAMLALLAERGVRYRTDEVGAYRVLHAFEPRRAITARDIDAVRLAPAPSAKAAGNDDDSETE